MPRAAIDEYLDYYESPYRWYWCLKMVIYTAVSLYMVHRSILLAVYVHHNFSDFTASIYPKKRKRSPRKVVKEYLLPRNGSLKIVADKQ